MRLLWFRVNILLDRIVQLSLQIAPYMGLDLDDFLLMRLHFVHDLFVLGRLSIVVLQDPPLVYCHAVPELLVVLILVLVVATVLSISHFLKINYNI